MQIVQFQLSKEHTISIDDRTASFQIMSSEVPQGQIISLSPNNFRAFAYTNLFQHNLTLFAFASEHMVFIFDRLTFRETQVTSPDPSSQICALTFSGRGTECCLLMVNAKGVLYKFRLDDVKSGPILTLNIGKVPISMTASNEMCFIQYEHCLSAVPIGQEGTHEELILTNTHSHDKCEVSPCGRALATFTRGGGPPVIWYSPFLKLKRSVLPWLGNLVDFQWGISEHLIAVSANSMGVVRLWVESVTSRELRCVKWFKFHDPVLSVSFAYQADVECVVETSRPSKSKLGDVYPLLTRTRALILATLDKKKENLCILQETSQPKMDWPAKITVSRENAVVTVCDFRRVFSKESIRRLVCITRFTKSSLSFHQCELALKEVTHIWPFVVPFVPAPVTKIFKRSEVITKFGNGVLYNWWMQRREENNYIDVMKFREGEIVVLPHSIVYREDGDTPITQYVLNESLVFASISNIGNNQAMVVAGNASLLLVLFLHEDLVFRVVNVDNVSNTQKEVSIHSSDLFVVCSSETVDAYMFKENKYHYFTSLQCEVDVACFLDHPMALLLVSFIDSLHFYIVTGQGFIPTEQITIKPVPGVMSSKPFPQLHCIRRTDKTSLLAASENLFFRVVLKKSLFPLPIPKESEFVLFTALSLSNFSVVSEFIRGPDINPVCFDEIVTAEGFRFPSDPRSDLPDLFKKICKKPPRNWSILDTCGLNFVFSIRLARSIPELWKLYPFFSIWALKSRDQHGICHSLQFKTAKQLFDSCIALWARDTSVLTKAIIELLEERLPKENEVDTFILFSILVKRMHTAKRIARVAQLDRLANFFQNFSTDAKMMVRIEKSAYEAQKQHRYSLAAMFFVLKGMTSQAMKVLSENKMLALITARLLDLENWPSYVEEKFAHCVDNFYGLWWNEKRDEALKVLREYRVPKCETLYTEMHRYEMVRAFGVDEPWDLLNVQLTPYFLRAYLNPHKNIVQGVDIPEHELKPPVPSMELLRPESPAVFSFGMDHWDDELDDSFSDSDSSESSSSEAPVAPPPKPADLFHSNLSISFTAEPYETGEPKIVTYNEKYIVSLIARLFNDDFDLEVIRFLAKIATTLHEQRERTDIVAAICYGLVFVFNKPNLMVILFSRPFDSSALESLFVSFESANIKMPISKPDVLSMFAAKSHKVTQDDVDLANFMTFHEICKVLEEIRATMIANKEVEPHNRMSILASFFHHRHRLLFRALNTYYFSDPSLAVALTNCGVNIEGLSDAMYENSLNRKWTITLPNPFISTFYSGDHFQCSRCFEINTGAEEPIKGVCINATNNHQVAFIEKELRMVNIKDYMIMKRSSSSCEGEGSSPHDPYSLTFDSPFAMSLPHQEAIPTVKFDIFQKRKFKPKWNKERITGKDVKATCIDAHPTEPAFVTGEANGFVHLWNFKRTLVSTSAVKYSDEPVSSLSFNQSGDRLLVTYESGYIFVSDFATANLVVSVPGSTAAWVNTDTQVVVCEPRRANLVVYDLLAGTTPMASFDLHKFTQKVPIAVNGSQVITGHDDGSVVMVDLRSGQVDPLVLHKSPVHALKFDLSGRFFMSGAAENSMQVVNAMITAQPEESTKLFSDFDGAAAKRGVLAFGTSKQTIAACGYSSNIRIWHVSDPKGLFV